MSSDTLDIYWRTAVLFLKSNWTWKEAICCLYAAYMLPMWRLCAGIVLETRRKSYTKWGKIIPKPYRRAIELISKECNRIRIKKIINNSATYPIPRRFAIISFVYSDAPTNALQAMLLNIENWTLKNLTSHKVRLITSLRSVTGGS